jgi:hypothetical protein
MPGTDVVPGINEERATGVEPVPPAWKAEALPLRYARMKTILPFRKNQVKVNKISRVLPGMNKVFLNLSMNI